MKTCPICGARCFDDMDLCYGCLHDFSRPMARSTNGMNLESGTIRGVPHFDDSDDAFDVDEPPDRIANEDGLHAAQGVPSSGPPWFATCYADRDDGGFVVMSGDDARYGSGTETLGAHGRAAALDSMSIPMLTVVRNAESSSKPSGQADCSSFVLRIPVGGNVLLCAR